MSTLGRLQGRAPQNGTQAHDRSREREFGRPAWVGATPFWDAQPWSLHPREGLNRAPSGKDKTENKNQKTVTSKA